MADITELTQVMKIAFAPQVELQYNKAYILFNKWGKGEGKKISFRGYEVPVQVGPNFNFSWFATGGTLPAGGTQTLKTATINFTSFVLAIDFAGLNLDATSHGDESAFVDWLSLQTEQGVTDACKILNILTYGTGTGQMAVADAGTANGIFLIPCANDADGVRFLRKNMVIDLLASGGSPTRIASGLITAIDPVANTFTSSVAVANGPTAATDIVVASGSYAKSLIGLRGIIDNASLITTLYGVDRTAGGSPEFRGQQVDAGANSLSAALLRQSKALIQISQGVYPQSRDITLVTHPAQIQQYLNLNFALKRFDGDTLDAGFTSYNWEGSEFIEDVDCQKNHIYFLSMNTLKKYEARALGFDDRTGSILNRIPAVLGTQAGAGQFMDRFVAFLLARLNIGCVRPSLNAKLFNLTVPSGY